MELNTNFFEHDTDGQIMQKRSEKELQFWVQHVNALVNENDRLAKVASNLVKKKDYRDEFLLMISDCNLLLKALHNYQKTMVNYKECDSLNCDLYYINQHEVIRKEYENLVTKNSRLKDRFYLMILD